MICAACGGRLPAPLGAARSCARAAGAFFVRRFMRRPCGRCNARLRSAPGTLQSQARAARRFPHPLRGNRSLRKSRSFDKMQGQGHCFPQQKGANTARPALRPAPWPPEAPGCPPLCAGRRGLRQGGPDTAPGPPGPASAMAAAAASSRQRAKAALGAPPSSGTKSRPARMSPGRQAQGCTLPQTAWPCRAIWRISAQCISFSRGRSAGAFCPLWYCTGRARRQSAGAETCRARRRGPFPFSCQPPCAAAAVMPCAMAKRTSFSALSSNEKKSSRTT